MFVATFNANSLRARIGIIRRWLLRSRCDVLCIQETKVQDKDFPGKDFEEFGYECLFKGQKAYNGVAIVSRHPFEEPAFGFGDSKDTEEDRARIVRARIKGVYIINIYAPQGTGIDHPNFQKKIQFFSRIRHYLEKAHTPRDPLLVVGDMNVAPEPRDVYAPERMKDHVCFHKDAREAFYSLIDWGLIDLFRYFNQGEKEYTFFDYRIPKSVERRLGWRIDHILATPTMMKRAKACTIDLGPRLWERPSDHTFLCAMFREQSIATNQESSTT